LGAPHEFATSQAACRVTDFSRLDQATQTVEAAGDEGVRIAARSGLRAWKLYLRAEVGYTRGYITFNTTDAVDDLSLAVGAGLDQTAALVGRAGYTHDPIAILSFLGTGAFGATPRISIDGRPQAFGAAAKAE